MQKHNLLNKERGVVLITCLIFLILLLTLLRFTIGSAKMSELKSGADFDELSAHVATSFTFNDAQLLIKRVDTNGVSLQNPNLNLQNNESGVLALAIDYWLDSANFANVNGIYDGDVAPCTNQLCTNHVADWQAACGGNSGFICYGAITNAGGIPQSQGKYIIERFNGKGPTLNIDLEPLQEVMVFRVTGIGYSQPNAAAGNATDVVRQDTYILTYQTDKK